MSEKVTDFTIGADPEFTCVDQKNRVISASDTVSEDDDFGVDGNGMTFEIRPKESTEPLQLVHNIHDIFVRQVIKDNDFLKFRWISDSWYSGYPLGGHIHFGVGSRVNHENAVLRLDNYLGLPSLLIETKSKGIRRRADGYGRMGDYRDQDWGFEYRPTSSWLTSPYVSAAILCLGKTVMYEMLNNSRFQWKELVEEGDFRNIPKPHLREKFSEIWKGITTMKLYQNYKPYIDLIYFLVKNHLTWTPRVNMKEVWGVVDMKPCISSKINLDVLWCRYNNE